MHRTLEAFSDSCAFNDNALTRTDTRVKLVLAMGTIVAILLSSKLLLPLAVFVACLVILPMLRIPRRALVIRLTGPLFLAGTLCLLKAVLSGSTPIATLPLGPWRITFTAEGLAAGLAVGSHVLGSVSVLVLLGSTTPAYKVFAALRWAGMPRTLVELAMLMYRYIFSLLEEVVNVHSAQRVRLGYVSFRRSFTSTQELMGMVLLRALDQADRTHEAMSARGYAHRLPMSTPGQLGLRDVAVMIAGLGILAAAFAASQMGPV